MGDAGLDGRLLQFDPTAHNLLVPTSVYDNLNNLPITLSSSLIDEPHPLIEGVCLANHQEHDKPGQRIGQRRVS